MITAQCQQQHRVKWRVQSRKKIATAAKGLCASVAQESDGVEGSKTTRFYGYIRLLAFGSLLNNKERRHARRCPRRGRVGALEVRGRGVEAGQRASFCWPTAAAWEQRVRAASPILLQSSVLGPAVWQQWRTHEQKRRHTLFWH